MYIRKLHGFEYGNIDNDRCAKMPIFSWIRKLNTCICLLFKQINCLKWMFRIFELSSSYSYNKNCTIPYSIYLSSDRAIFAFSGPTSFTIEISLQSNCSSLTKVIMCTLNQTKFDVDSVTTWMLWLTLTFVGSYLSTSSKVFIKLV